MVAEKVPPGPDHPNLLKLSADGIAQHCSCHRSSSIDDDDDDDFTRSRRLRRLRVDNITVANCPGNRSCSHILSLCLI